jgi:hypothetical protein
MLCAGFFGEDGQLAVSSRHTIAMRIAASMILLLCKLRWIAVLVRQGASPM